MERKPIISYHTSGGFTGTGDHASFDLYEDGTIERRGKHAGKLSDEEVKDLLDLFEENDFFSMEESYRARGCDTYIYNVTYGYGGKNKSVRVDQLSREAPEGFWKIRDRLYEIGKRDRIKRFEK